MMRATLLLMFCAALVPAQNLYVTGRVGFHALREVDPLSAATIATGANWGAGGNIPYPQSLVHDGSVLARASAWFEPLDPTTGIYAQSWPLWMIVPYGQIWDASYDFTREEYVASTNNREIYSTEFLGSHQTVLSSSNQYFPLGVAVDRFGVIWFWDTSSSSLYQLDRTTSTVSPGPTLSLTTPSLSSMAFHPETGLLYAATGGYAATGVPLNLYVIDPATGNTALIGSHGIEAARIAFSPASVVGSGGEGRTGTRLTLGLNSPPTIGNSNFAVRFSNLHGDLYGGAPTFLFLASGLESQPVAFSAGNSIYLDIASTQSMIQNAGFPWMQTLMWTERTTDWPVAIPNDPGLLGATVYLQAAVSDMSFTGGLRLSNALALRLY